MKKRRIAVLFFMALTLLTIGCREKPKEVRPWKPASRVILRGQDDTHPHPHDGPVKWNAWDSLFVIAGPGSFISAVVSRKGGTPNRTDHTTVRLSLDDKEIVLKSFEVARAMGLSTQNYSGLVWLEGDAHGGDAHEGDAHDDEDPVETLVLGYTQPLYFKETLIVSVLVDSTEDDVGDDRVKKLLAYVTFTNEHAGDDGHDGGGDHQPSYP